MIQIGGNAIGDNQIWNITWSGTSTPTRQGSIGTGGTFVVTGANTATLTFGTDTYTNSGFSGIGNVQLTFPVSNHNDPPHNIKVFQAQYAANVANGEYFNPDWLAMIKPFGVLRFMDWCNSYSNGQTSIPQLADMNYNSMGLPFYAMGPSSGYIIGNALFITITFGGGEIEPGCSVTGVPGE